MKVEKKLFGVLPSGEDVFLFILEAGDLVFSLTEAGATWANLYVPSRNHGKADVLLGYATFDGFAHNNNFFGCTVGRYANRIGGAEFSVHGKKYSLFKNNGKNSLHGGRVSYAKRRWKGESYTTKDGVFVRFELFSPDGDEGFPGNLRAAVTYGLTHSNELFTQYEARSDQMTPVNFTNHVFFNLAGEGSGTTLDHELAVHASHYLDVDSGLIPTGKLAPVEGTALDFRKPKTIGKDIDRTGLEGGYDHCFALDGFKPSDAADRPLFPCADAFDPKTGRKMKVTTTQPGVQLYSGNGLNRTPGKPGSYYNIHDGFCLETQNFPDAPNKPDFPDPFYGPGRDYLEKALFAFDW